MVQRLNSAIQKALQAPAVVQAFQDGGIVSLAGSSDQFAGFIRSGIDKYAQAIRKAAELITRWMAEAVEACDGADVIVAGIGGQSIAEAVAEKLG